MKNIMKFLLAFSFSLNLLLTTVACTGYDFNGGNVPPTPPPPVSKDIKYYQKLMQDCENVINDFINNINELAKYQNDKHIFPTPEDYTRTIAELKAEQANYQATVYDCQYQILYLQTNGSFNPSEKTQAITYLQNELTQLQKELATKEKYSDDYNRSELAAIKIQIKNAELIINSLINIKLSFIINS